MPSRHPEAGRPAGGCRGAKPMAPLSPPPDRMCCRDPHRRLATPTLAAARSSGLGSRWRPPSRRVGLEPARRGCAHRAVILTSIRSRPSPAACRTTSPAMSPAPDVCRGHPTDGGHDAIRRPPWHRSSHTVLDPGPAAARSPTDMRGGKIEFGNIGNRPYQVVLRVSELRRGLQGYRTCRCERVRAHG
jgi:hypothetical protein